MHLQDASGGALREAGTGEAQKAQAVVQKLERLRRLVQEQGFTALIAARDDADEAISWLETQAKTTQGAAGKSMLSEADDVANCPGRDRAGGGGGRQRRRRK